MAPEEEGQDKYGVACRCTEETAPTDLTKIATGQAYICPDCGRGWKGTGPVDH